MSWDLNWRERIPALTRLLRKKGIPLQVIYNGNDNLKSDKAWIDSAVANFKAYEAEGRAPPDVAVINYEQNIASCHLLRLETNYELLHGKFVGPLLVAATATLSWQEKGLISYYGSA